MNISNVELQTHHPEADEDGNHTALLTPHFAVTTDEDERLIVPFDPLNMEYVAVSEWYGDQKKKPFKFDFKNAKPE
jgi:hypothetical protein